MRPDRSDAHLSPEEAAEIEQEARRYFESIAPKRHPKPSRSDLSSDHDHDDNLDLDDINFIPAEFQKLRHLEVNPQLVVFDEAKEVVEEYVETEYYKDLNCIDKQHHTTGTGFIKVENSGDGSCSFDLASVSAASVHNYNPASNYKGNPATNDWIPSADPVIPVSNKPGRSDI